MSFSSYEQEFVINDQIISGISSASISYGSSVEPLYLAGIGYIDSFINGPVEGDLSITRYMLGPDILADKRDNQDLTGGFVLGEGVQEAGFTKGRVISRKVSCNIGEIPAIDNTIRIYGNFGGGIPAITGSYTDSQGNPISSYEGVKVNQEDREYIIPTQGSIAVEIGGNDYDILGFAIDRTLTVEALYALNKEHINSLKNYEAHDIQIIYPIETKLDFTISQEDYNILQMRELMDYDSIQSSVENLNVKIYDPQTMDDPTPRVINEYNIVGAKLSSVNQSSATEQETTVALSFVGFETDPRTPDTYPTEQTTPTPSYGTDATGDFITAEEQANSDERMFGGL
tara:strand:+ start:21299 stop:22327 length:1029 start_codon:yes stop_codon:yes gene_type:complete